MKLYDLTYLLPPNLSLEEQKTTQDKIRTLIEQEGGVLDAEQPLTLKNMAYPIKKQDSVLMGNLNFHLSPEKTPEFSAKLNAEENILRYLLVVAEKAVPTKKLRVRRPSRTHLPPKLGKEITTKIKPEKKPKVEMEKLEEKLEELLGE